MRVYADGLSSGLRTARPDWDIVEWVPPEGDVAARLPFAVSGIHKYWTRFILNPKEISRTDADIYHIIDHGDAHIAKWLSAKNKITVVTCHDLINLYFHDDMKLRARLPVISRVAWKYGIKHVLSCNKIISVSKSTTNDLVNLLGAPQEKIAMVPNGIDQHFRQFSDVEKKRIKSDMKWRNDTIYLLNVGVNLPRKNVISVLRSVLAIKDLGVSVYFIKAGADFSLTEKEFIAQHRLDSCVEYVGYVSQESLIGLYNCTDALVAPSLAEGFGLTLIEAMACGLPVITANVSAMPEVVGDAAALVDPLDVDAIVREIISLHTSEDVRKARIEKGLQRAQAFTWIRAAERVARVYEGLVAHP